MRDDIIATIVCQVPTKIPQIARTTLTDHIRISINNWVKKRNMGSDQPSTQKYPNNAPQDKKQAEYAFQSVGFSAIPCRLTGPTFFLQ